MQDVGLPGFLAFSQGVANFVTVLLGSHRCEMSISFLANSTSAWLVNPSETCSAAVHVQQAWDDVGVKRIQCALLEGSSGADIASPRAVSRTETVLICTHCLHLICITITLRLGCNVCEYHVCGSGM